MTRQHVSQLQYVTADPPERNRRSGTPRRWWILATAGVAQLMVVLDATIVNIALPSAQRALGFADADRQWVVTAYALAFGSLLLIGGRLADLLGRNRTFVAGLIGFAAASAVAGAAGNFATLVAGRAAQGVFGALLAPAALSIVAVTFDDSRHRARAFGIFGAIAGAGGAVGLLAGGLLTQHLNWRWTLYVNVILAAIGVAGAAGFLRRGARSAQRPALDWWGTALVSAGLFAVVYGLSRADSAGWASASSWGFLVAAVVLLAAFAWWQARAAHPLMPLRILADRDRAASVLALTLASAGIYAVFLFLTFYLQNLRAFTPVQTGVAFLPMIATVVVGSLLGSNVLLRVIGPKLTVPLGLLAAAGGMAWLTRLADASSYAAVVLPPLLLLGLGLGVVFAPAISLATARVGRGDAGVASALVNTTQQIGGAAGIALLSTMATNAAKNFLVARDPRDPTALIHAALDGYRAAYWWAAALLAAGMLISAALYRPGRSDPKDLRPAEGML